MGASGSLFHAIITQFLYMLQNVSWLLCPYIHHQHRTCKCLFSKIVHIHQHLIQCRKHLLQHNVLFFFCSTQKLSLHWFVYINTLWDVLFLYILSLHLLPELSPRLHLVKFCATHYLPVSEAWMSWVKRQDFGTSCTGRAGREVGDEGGPEKSYCYA